ncbi:MAG: CsbD family protein [Bryobacteraceae bacterium]
MNWNEVEGKWNQLQGKVREKWGKLTDNDIHTIGGKKDQFLGKLQERYGMARSQAEKELDAWMQGLHETETPKTRSSGGSERF